MGQRFYPYLFKPNQKTLVWGTEDWTVSAVPGSESEIANGTWAGIKLPSLVSRYPVEILGKKVAETYGNQLPLLAKIIDTQRDLSIQVHPNDEMAQREHGKMGKSEMWYIIDAQPGSYLYAGFNKEVTPEEYKEHIRNNTITDILARHEVKTGDVFYLPAGRVHAIGAGILLAEVQQSSDITYRIYDYNRPGMDGKPRELHTELAAQALNFHVEDEYRTIYSDKVNRANLVIDSPYFTIRMTESTRPFHRNLMKYDSFVICMSLEGDCRIRIKTTGDEIAVPHGNSCLIPAAIADYDILPVNGRSKTLAAFINNLDNSLSGKVNRFLHIGV